MQYRGVDYNTNISALYNINILTSITPGTLKIKIGNMTAITPDFGDMTAKRHEKSGKNDEMTAISYSL